MLNCLTDTTNYMSVEINVMTWERINTGRVQGGEFLTAGRFLPVETGGKSGQAK